MLHHSWLVFDALSRCLVNAAATYMLDGLLRWESFAGGQAGNPPPHLCAVPPRPSAVPARPFLLDSALGYINAPTLEHRMPKEAAKGTFARLFTGWGGKK